jgi:arylsulfatase A-like enzyme
MQRLTRLIMLILTAAIVAAGVSCSLSRKPGPNIVLIVIDTLRADRLPFYGYTQDTAPFLSELAAQGTVFDNAHSTSSWTAPATASIFTSLYPFQHTVITGFGAYENLIKKNWDINIDRVPQEIVTLPEVLSATGYRTYAVTDNVNICERGGFNQGFDLFVNFEYESAAKVNAQVKAWKEEIRTGGKYFLYLHYMDPHWEYHQRSRVISGSRKLSDYDSEIAYTDEHIQELFELFDWGENTLVIVTSDHGEEFGDHGGVKHGHTLYTEVMRVPLFVCYPEGGVRAQRVREHVSVIDILPTIRGFVGLPMEDTEEGIDLASICTGGKWEDPDRYLYGHLWRKQGTSEPEDDLVVRAVLSGRWKYLWTSPDREELYDMETDRGERRNRLDEFTDKSRSFLARYTEFERGCLKYAPEHEKIKMDEKLLKKLRSLGYVQ